MEVICSDISSDICSEIIIQLDTFRGFAKFLATCKFVVNLI